MAAMDGERGWNDNGARRPWSDLQTSIRLGHGGGGGGSCWLCVVAVVARNVVVVWLVLPRPVGAVGGIARGMGRGGGDSREWVWMRLRMRLRLRLLEEEILFGMEQAGPGLAGLSPQLVFETMVINGRRLTELGLSAYYHYWTCN